MSAAKRHGLKAREEEEDAAQLKLGPEFSDDQAGAISISEAKVLLERKEAESQQQSSEHPVYKKTLEYVRNFARFKDVDASRQVREALKHDLRSFEVVQIANLCPVEAEEAKTLIPSIQADDETLQAMLNDIAAIRRFQN